MSRRLAIATVRRVRATVLLLERAVREGPPGGEPLPPPVARMILPEIVAGRDRLNALVANLERAANEPPR